jgi:HTH-type transcriptional regulator / antitoxin HipB
MTRVSDAADLGRLVRLRRREERETQQNLADVCRVGRGSVAKLERGEANMQLGIALRLVQALGLNVEIAPRSASVAMSAAEVTELVEHDRALVALGQRVRRLREQRNMSEQQLAGAANLTPRRLEAIEVGRFDPPFDVLLALTDALGVKAAELVGGEAEPAGS